MNQSDWKNKLQNMKNGSDGSRSAKASRDPESRKGSGSFASASPQQGEGDHNRVESRRLIPLEFTEENINELARNFVENVFCDQKRVKRDVTMTQIRKLLSSVNHIQNKLEAGKPFEKKDTDYIRVKLAYQTGRNRGKAERAYEKMFDELDPILSNINNDADFRKFSRLIEGIVAYHKFYGGN